jgi:hypothetical protein
LVEGACPGGLLCVARALKTEVMENFSSKGIVSALAPAVIVPFNCRYGKLV